MTTTASVFTSSTDSSTGHGWLRARAATESPVAGRQARERSRSAGFHAHLVKPVSMTDVMSTLDQLLG